MPDAEVGIVLMAKRIFGQPNPFNSKTVWKARKKFSFAGLFSGLFPLLL